MVKNGISTVMILLLFSCYSIKNNYELIPLKKICEEDLLKIRLDGYYYSMNDTDKRILVYIFSKNGKMIRLGWFEFLSFEDIENRISNPKNEMFIHNQIKNIGKFKIDKNKIITQLFYGGFWSMSESYYTTDFYNIINTTSFKHVETIDLKTINYKNFGMIFTFRKFSNENNLEKVSRYLDENI